MGKYDDRPYEVGKGKPPRNHRFKPGQSGNPRGPTRKARAGDASMNELLAEIVNEDVAVTINNRTIRMPKKKAILIGIVHDAANGTPAQRLKVFNALEKLGAFDLLPADRQADPGNSSARTAELVHQLAAEFGLKHEEGKGYYDPYIAPSPGQ